MATALRRGAVDCPPVRVAGGDDDPDFERACVDRARSGEREAFAALYREYVPKIHAFAYRRTNSRELAEDITARRSSGPSANSTTSSGVAEGSEPGCSGSPPTSSPTTTGASSAAAVTGARW